MKERPLGLVLGFTFVSIEYNAAPLQASTAVDSSTSVEDARPRPFSPPSNTAELFVNIASPLMFNSDEAA